MRLQPQGTNSGTADGLNDSEANTATLHETTQRLHGQHLSGPTEGTEGSAFTTPAGVRCPQGQSPVTGVSNSQKWGACAVILTGVVKFHQKAWHVPEIAVNVTQACPDNFELADTPCCKTQFQLASKSLTVTLAAPLTSSIMTAKNSPSGVYISHPDLEHHRPMTLCTRV